LSYYLRLLNLLIVFTLLNRVPCGKFNRVNNKMGFGFLENVYEKYKARDLN